jgi:hypothetical protein
LTQAETDRAYAYLSRLFVVCAPQCEPLPTLLGVCTQIDNLIAGYRIKLGEMPDPGDSMEPQSSTAVAPGEN